MLNNQIPELDVLYTGITTQQKRLIQNYQTTIDEILKKNESLRSEQYNKLKYCWENILIPQLIDTLKHAAILGLDSMQKNNLSFIILKDKITTKYSVNFWIGYVGKELIATKYAYDMPNVTAELLHSNDKFKVVKKDINNPVENYIFELGDPFDLDRTVIGGFYYFDYSKKNKNIIYVMTLKDILKRKPPKASVDFWGGQKDVWENGKKTGKTEIVEGWFEEMCLKTIKNKAFDSITLDPAKMDETYQFLKLQESEIASAETCNEIGMNANKTELVIDPDNITNSESDMPF